MKLGSIGWLLVLLAACFAASQAATVCYVECGRRRLAEVVEASKVSALGTTSDAHLRPDMWKSVVGSFGLPTLLHAQRGIPSAWDLLTMRDPELRRGQSILWGGVVVSTVIGGVIGWWLALRRWRLWAARGESILLRHERVGVVRNVTVSAAMAGAVLPLIAGVMWVSFADRDLESGGFLTVHPSGIGQVMASMGALVLVACGVSVVRSRAWRVGVALEGGRCDRCGYRGVVGERCAECGVERSRVPVRWWGVAWAWLAFVAGGLVLPLAGPSVLAWTDPTSSQGVTEGRSRILFRYGELVWIRWEHVQAYVCFRHQEPNVGTDGRAVCRVAWAAFDGAVADADPGVIATTLQEWEDVAGGAQVERISPGGIESEVRLGGGAGWLELKTHRPREVLRFPEANNGSAMGMHVWMLAHGLPSPYAAPGKPTK